MASKYPCPFFVGFLILAIWACLGLGREVREMSMSERHEQWMARHGRVYKDAEEKDQRLQIFKDNVEFIESFNKAGNKSYKLSINEFSDLTNEEFMAYHTGYKPTHSRTSRTSFMYENVTEVPFSVDWREEGAVTDVKNQWQCGCCWAFSAVAAVEGIIKLRKGKLLSLSEQELVDCNAANHGCSGGLPDYAFEFIQQNQGLASEDNYPYQKVEGTCNTGISPEVLSQITGYEDVPANSETALMKAVANQPVSVGIEGSGLSFQHYSTGVFEGDCGNRLNHAVTVVGYGTEDGKNYWLVKNSWGTGWGEDGYMKIKRDVGVEEGMCGLAMQASYPTASA